MITTEARWTAPLTEPQTKLTRLAPSSFQATRNLRHNMVAWRRKQNQAAQNGGENGTTHTKGGENGTAQTQNFCSSITKFSYNIFCHFWLFSLIYIYFYLRAVVRGDPKYLTRPSAVWFLVAAGSTDHKHGLAR